MATRMGWREELRPGEALRGLVQIATAALIEMDADRLEELARCCADLNLDSQLTGEEQQREKFARAMGMAIDERPQSSSESARAMDYQIRSLSLTAERSASSAGTTKVDLKIMERVLFETRANLRVLSHLHSIRVAQAELSGMTRVAELEGKVDYGDN